MVGGHTHTHTGGGMVGGHTHTHRRGYGGWAHTHTHRRGYGGWAHTHTGGGGGGGGVWLTWRVRNCLIMSTVSPLVSLCTEYLQCVCGEDLLVDVILYPQS